MDVLAGAILALGTDGITTRHETPFAVTSIIRRRSAGGFVIATGHLLARTNETLTSFEPFAQILHDSDVRINDGGCDPLGGFVAGSMAYDESPGRGAVFRVAGDGGVIALLDSAAISNGVQWTADGSRVFYIDTPTRRVDSFDVDAVTCSWSNRQVHIDLSDADGFPDGMTIDDEDGLWIAMWGGSSVRHYDRNGQLVEIVKVPEVSQVSSCCFGGDEGSTLFITTSRQGLQGEIEPAAGSLFSVQTNARGATLREFAG